MVQKKYSKILYDSFIFQSQKTGGISRYHYELFKGIRREGFDAKIAGIFIKNQYLLSDKNLKKGFINDPTASFAFFNKLLIKSVLRRSSNDTVFHPTFPLKYLSKNDLENRKMVFTIHDLIPIKSHSDEINQTFLFAKFASKIIAISETTKQDIVDICNINPDKIEVIYHGNSLNPDNAIKPQTPLPERYLLYVGNRDGHKNFVFFLSAIAPVLKNDKSLFLVCAGRRNFNPAESDKIKALNIENQVVFIKDSTDDELAWMFAKAEIFVFPSTDEGFGIPILESWNCGTPVALSNIPVFNEIAAEGGCYFEPDSEESIRETISKLLANKNLRSNLIKSGKIRLQNFSWENTVQQTADLYKSIL